VGKLFYLSNFVVNICDYRFLNGYKYVLSVCNNDLPMFYTLQHHATSIIFCNYLTLYVLFIIFYSLFFGNCSQFFIHLLLQVLSPHVWVYPRKTFFICIKSNHVAN